MATRTISTKLVLDGEAEYRAKLKNINAELALQKSELEKVQAQYRNSANSLEALSAKQAALKGQIDALNEKHREQSAMLDKAREAQQKYAAQVEELKGKLSGLAGSAEDTSEEQKKLQEELDAAEESLQKAANSVTFYQKQLNNTERDQAKLGTELDKTGQYLDEAKASADGCARSIDQYGKEVKQAGDNSEKFGTTSKEAVNQLATALAAAGVAKSVKEIADALMDCVGTFADFQAQMSTVQAISGATGEEMAALAEKAKYMGATTAFTAEEAGQALEYMAMAGWKTNDMLGGLEGIMNLAAASGESLGATSDIVTDALTAFGLTARDSSRFADVLAAASSNANTNVSMMGETFKYAAPVAGALGYSIEDTALAIGLMANAGIKGSQAGTALRGTLTNLAKPSKEVSAYMQKLGISLTDNSGATRSLSELMDILRDRFSDLTEAQQAEYAAGLAGKEAMSGLLAIVNAGEADYQKLTDAISASSGAAKEMAEIRLDNYAGQMTLLSSAADGLKLAVGEQLTPALTNLAKAGTDAFAWATEFVGENEWVVGAVVGITAAFAALTAGVIIYEKRTELATAKTAMLNAVMNANPAVFVASALIGLVTAIGIYAASADDASGDTKEFTKSLEESKKAYEDLHDTMSEQQGSTRAAADALKDLLAVEDKSAAQKAVILELIEQLNEAVPGLELAYDREKDALVGLTEAEVDSAIAKVQAQEAYQAQVERLSELYAERAEISDRLAEAQSALAEGHQQSREEMASYFDIAVDYNNALEQGSTDTRELENTVRALTAAQADNAAQIAELEEASSAYAQRQQEDALAIETMTARVDDLTGRMQSLEEEYQKSWVEAMESIDAQIGLFNELDGKAKTSIDSLINTLKGQVAYMDDYAANIKKAMEMGVDEGLVKKLSDGSEESAQILDAIVKGGEDDIAALNEQFAKVEEGKRTFSDTVAEMEHDFDKEMERIVRDLNDAMDEMDVADSTYQIGEDNIQGLINGTASKKAELVRKYAEMGRAALAAYKREVDQRSPSHKFEQAGRFDIQGIAQGAEGEKGNLEKTYKGIGKAALSALEEILPSGRITYDPEVDYSSLMLAAETLEEFEQYAAQRTAKIIGEHIDLVEHGYSDNTQLLKQWMKSVGSTAEDVEGIIRNIEKTIQGIDYDPDVDYSSLMLAAETLEEFEQYAAQRTAKIIGEHIDLVEQGYSDNTQLLKQWMQSVGYTAEDVEGIIRNIEKTIQGIDYDPDVDYSSLMLAAETLEEFEQYAAQRTAKIIGEHIDTVAQGYADNAAILEQWRSTVEQTMTGIEKSVNGVSYDPNVDYSALMLEAKSVEEFLELSNKRAAKIAGENIDVVARGYADNIQLLEQWSSAIQESRDDLVRAADDMAAEFSRRMDEVTKSLNDAIQEMNVKEEAFQVGENNIRGLIDGTISKRDDLVDTYAQMGRDALAAYKREVDQRSPSHKFEQAGRFDIQGLIHGAENEADHLDAAYAKLAQTALRSMERGLPSIVAEPPAIAIQERQTAAIVSAIASKDGGGGGIPIHIDKLVVRDDSDIHRIAQELYYLTERERRSRGGGSL